MSELSTKLVLTSRIASDDEARMAQSDEFKEPNSSVETIIEIKESTERAQARARAQRVEQPTTKSEHSNSSIPSRLEKIGSTLKGGFSYLKNSCVSAGEYVWRSTPIYGRIFFRKMRILVIDGSIGGSVIYVFYQYPPSLGLAFVSQSLIGPLLSPRIPALIRSAVFFVPECLLSTNLKNVWKAEVFLEKLYEIRDQKTGQHNPEVIEVLTTELERSLEMYNGFSDLMGSSPPWLHNLIQKQIPLLFNFPINSTTELSYRLSDAKRKDKIDTMLNNFTNKCLAHFDVKPKDLLIKHCRNILSRIIPLQGYHFEHRLPAVQLNGPMGIGKTHIVKMLAEMFELPICIIIFKEKGLEIISGSKSITNDESPTPSIILKTITDTYNNPKKIDYLIVFMDEIDKMIGKDPEKRTEKEKQMITFLHQFLDSSTTVWNDDGYNLKYNVRNVIIFFGTNSECFKNDKALENERIILIDMPKLDLTGKVQILKIKLEDDFLSKIYASKEENERIVGVKKLLMRYLMQDKIQQIAASDKDDGARIAIRRMDDCIKNRMSYEECTIISTKQHRNVDSEFPAIRKLKEDRSVKNGILKNKHYIETPFKWQDSNSIIDIIELILHKLAIFEAVAFEGDEEEILPMMPMMPMMPRSLAPSLGLNEETPQLRTTLTPHFDQKINQKKKAEQREKMEKIAKLAESSKFKSIKAKTTPRIHYQQRS